MLRCENIVPRRRLRSLDQIIRDPDDLASEPLPPAVEQFVRNAATLLSDGDNGSLARYDSFPAPLYATDASGAVTYFNDACVEFAGRLPEVGRDRYCVTWRLWDDDGAFLPHDQCPMAIALRDQRPVRGVEALAERPDGARRRFRPFATPALDASGKLVGAVNLLVPTDGEACHDLLATAQKCRRLSRWVDKPAVSATLLHMAGECEANAAVLRLD